MMKRMNFAVYIQFTNPSGDQLGVLRSEINDQDRLVHAQN